MIYGCWLNFICDNNIKEYYLKNCTDKEISEKNKKFNVYQMIKLWFLLVLDNY
jgi:hypothetical protein